MKNTSFSKVSIILILLVNCLLLLPQKAQAVPFKNSYSAVVKIYTYTEDYDYNLTATQTGSGVFVNNDGVILTNHHVVTAKDIFDDDIDVAYRVCATNNTVDEPNCAYTADLIFSDEDKDIALLKLRDLGLSAQTSFNYFDRPENRTFLDGDYVQALGYPSVGGSTITGTIGTIAGTMTQYAITWIKSTALISFGSSGGALVDLDGYLIGITSGKISDVGYAIDITEINGWIDENIDKTPTPSSLSTKMNSLITKQIDLKRKNIFLNSLPYVQITKPDSWKYTYNNENYIYIDNSENVNGGKIGISWYKSDTYTEPMLDITVKLMILSDNYLSAGNVTLGGKTGRKLISRNSDNEEIYWAKLPSKNYLVTVNYYYGKDEIDKEAVDSIIKTLIIKDDNNNFQEQRVYEHDSPYFKISLPNSWSLLPNNLVAEPVDGQKPSVPEIGWGISSREITEAMQKSSNADYFNYIKDSETIKSRYEDRYNLKADRYFESMNYKINNELTNEIFYKYRFKDEEDGDKVKMFAAGYRIRDNDRVIIVGFSYLGEDENQFEKYLADFQNEVLTNLTLGREIKTETNSQPTQTQTQAEVKNSAKTNSISDRLSGRILLQVEEHGEAWYINPKDKKRYYMADGGEAYRIMRYLGVGITNKDLDKVKADASFAKKHCGKIFLQVESVGEAYYIDINGNAHYLKDGSAAYTIMRELGLGITNTDLSKIEILQIN